MKFVTEEEALDLFGAMIDLTAAKAIPSPLRFNKAFMKWCEKYGGAASETAPIVLMFNSFVNAIDTMTLLEAMDEAAAEKEKAPANK